MLLTADSLFDLAVLGTGLAIVCACLACCLMPVHHQAVARVRRRDR